MIVKELTVYLPQDTSVKLSLSSRGNTADMDIERTDEYAPGSVCHVLEVDELRLLAKQFNLMADMIEEENNDDDQDESTDYRRGCDHPCGCGR